MIAFIKTPDPKNQNDNSTVAIKWEDNESSLPELISEFRGFLITIGFVESAVNEFIDSSVVNYLC